MKVSKNCLDLVKRFEGFSTAPYLDAVGIPTIGYGSTFYEDGTKVSMCDVPMSEEAASKLLELKLNLFCIQIDKMVNIDLSQNQIDALASLVYNIGPGNFKTSTLLKKLNLDDIDGAASEFLKWNKAGGKVLSGLVKRRKEEMELFLA